MYFRIPLRTLAICSVKQYLGLLETLSRQLFNGYPEVREYVALVYSEELAVGCFSLTWHGCQWFTSMTGQQKDNRIGGNQPARTIA